MMWYGAGLYRIERSGILARGFRSGRDGGKDC